MALALAALALARGGATQVLTVKPDGAVHTTALTPRQEAILATALEGATGEAGPNLLSEYQAFPLPLGPGNAAAIVAISMHYGANADSAFMIFRQEKDQDVLILNSVAGDYDFRDVRHHGYRDMVLTNYMGVHQMVSVWRFDGEHYQVARCTEKTAGGPDSELPPGRCG
jgi:hypothetical protein